MSQEMYKVIQDITQKVIQEIKMFHDFPESIKVNKAILTLEPDGFSGSLYYITVEYEFDNTKYVIKRPVYTRLTSTIDDMIYEIVDHYRRMHLE